MTYPNQPPPQQPYPQAPYPQQPAAQPPYAPYPQQPAAQPPYAPAPPQAPYPPQTQPPGQPYPPQQQGYYPPQQQQVPQGPAPPQPTVADFLNQPKSGEGPTLSDFLKNINQSITGIVARAIDKGDMRVSMDMNNPTQPARRKDGSLKYYMQVPLQVNSAFFPEGRVRWIVQGQAQGELSRAMSAAGCLPEIQVPEYGAEITITKVGQREIKNMSPQAIYQVIYRRPPGAATQAPWADEKIQQPNGQLPGQAPQPQGQVTPQPYAPPVQPQQPAPQAGQGQYTGHPDPLGTQNPDPRYQQGYPQERYDTVSHPVQPQQPAPQQPPAAAAPYNAQAGMQRYAPEMQHPQQPQWPAPGAPLSVPPQPAPPGTNPYNNPQLPPNQPDVAGQIAYATQQGVQAAQQAPAPPQAPQQYATQAGPITPTPEQEALLARVASQQAPPAPQQPQG